MLQILAANLNAQVIEVGTWALAATLTFWSISRYFSLSNDADQAQ